MDSQGDRGPAGATRPAEVAIVQLNKMWHFVDGKKASAGSAKPSIRSVGEPLIRAGARVSGQRDDALCQQLLDKIGI
jgi:hypothetical protein